MMTYKQIKTKLKIQSEMRKHYQEMYNTCIGELKFEKLQAETYKNILDEVQTLLQKGVNNKLIKSVIENGVNRGYLDKLIHANLIFK